MRTRHHQRSIRRGRRLAILLAVGAMVLTACGGGGTFDDNNQAAAETGSGSESGGGGGAAGSDTLVIAQPDDIVSMDPAMHRARTTQAVVRNVFDALVNQGPDLKPVPELATSWEAVNDTTWRFHLRKGVTFHNGEEFNADAVKFSIERVLDPAQKSPRASMLSMIDSVTVEDPYTVVITTKEPSPILLAELSVNEIVPPKYVKEVGDEEFAKKPVGTGPFTFVEHVPNERVVLEANPDYWDGAPKVKRVIFRPIPEVSARMAALKSGEVQIAAEIPPDLADGLSGDVKAVSVDGTRVFFLAMNVTKPPFDSRNVRVGVNTAVDRKALVDDLLQGYGRPLYQPLFPEVAGYDKGYDGYHFDLDKAKQLLAGAGQPVTIDVEEKDRTLAQAVAGQLQAAGLDASVNVLEKEAFNQKIESGGEQAYISSWGVAEADADVIFARHFWSETRADAFYTGYKNADLDKLIVAGRSTVDEAKREKIYAQAVEMVMHDAPWAPLLNAKEVFGVSTRVQNWDPSPIGRFNIAKTSLS